MPDTGHSGRANNVEDVSDPYGGGDVPGPYGMLVCMSTCIFYFSCITRSVMLVIFFEHMLDRAFV